MRIGYLWDCEYPWDVRTEKVCAALTAAGHEVHILARNRDRAPVVERLAEGIVHRLRPLRVGGRKLESLTSFPAFFNPRWLRHLARCVHECRFDLLIVRDLPLCPTALWASDGGVSISDLMSPCSLPVCSWLSGSPPMFCWIAPTRRLASPLRIPSAIDSKTV